MAESLLRIIEILNEISMKESLSRPIVLVHGLWDTHRVFSKLIESLQLTNAITFTPFLPHKLGCISLRSLAKELNLQIIDRLGSEMNIDLVGFSMGGIVSRIWLQELSGFKRTKKFITVGSPHYGTYAAQFIPSWPLKGIADMKRNSMILSSLNSDFDSLKTLNCKSLFCRWDLMVVPGWQAVMPFGDKYNVPVFTHRDLIRSSKAINMLTNIILSDQY